MAVLFEREEFLAYIGSTYFRPVRVMVYGTTQNSAWYYPYPSAALPRRLHQKLRQWLPISTNFGHFNSRLDATPYAAIAFIAFILTSTGDRLAFINHSKSVVLSSLGS